MRKNLVILALVAVVAVSVSVSVFLFTDIFGGSSPDEEAVFDKALKNLTKTYEVEEWTIDEYKQYYKGDEEGLNITDVSLDNFLGNASKEVEGFSRRIYYDRDNLVIWFDDFTSQAGEITIYRWSPK